MDDFVRTIPLPAATESTEVPSDVESDEDERLDLGFKWESSEASSDSEAASNDSASEVTGADSDNEDAAAASDDADDSGGSSDENDDEEDAEDIDGDDSDVEKVVSADEAAAADADSSAGEEEESKIPRYKPGTHEKVPEFAELHLSRPLLRAVNEMKYKVPTTIQWKTIPPALAGNDICGSAQTGSGKTAAFLLPALERLLFRDKRVPATRVVIVLPTRELASQCHDVACKLAQYTDIKCCLAVGGLSLKAQEIELRARPDIVIGTPGRLIDHLQNSPSIHFDNVDVLILDEADKLLEMGFKEEVIEIVKACPVERQTLFFSATMTSKVEELASFTLKKPLMIQADPLFDLANKLSQEFVRVRNSREHDREAMLVSLLTRQFKRGVIVFFDKKQDAHRMHIVLSLLGFNCGELHGNLSQQQRQAAYDDFDAGRIDVMVATDLAGRGLDMKGVRTVINFEMPRDLTAYTHRVGRTARAGRSGHAVTLTGEGRRSLMKEIVKHASGDVKARVIPNEDIEKWRAKISTLEPQVIQRYKQERLEKEARIAEMEANKAYNMITHEDEIHARPAREWFMSAKDKQALKDATKLAVTGEVRAPKKTAAEKKRQHAKDSDDSEPEEIRIGSDSDDDDTGKSAFERRDGRRESKKPKQGGSGRPWEKSERKPREHTGHRLTRKKRRKMESKEVGFGSISKIKMAKKKQQTSRIRMH